MMLRRSPMKRTPMRRKAPVVVLPRRSSREERKLWTELRKAVWHREDGRCASCLAWTPLTDGECHHRRLKSRQGPNTAHNCVWLCQTCHAGAHRDPTPVSTRHGWLVPSWADEHAWPVWQPGGREGWWQPGPGSWTPAEPSDVQLQWRKDRRTA